MRRVHRAILQFTTIFLFMISFNELLFSDTKIRIAVNDFAVQSDNPQYKYLGKGFAEFVGIDIVKSPGVDLVDREKRIDAIREQELSMTGLIEEKDQIKIGNILAANYIVSGKIFDMAGSLLVTYKVIDTSDARVVMQDKVTGSLASYDYITAQISRKILTNFALKVPTQVAVKAEKPVDKQEGAAVNFSNAVNAFDTNDLALAKSELEKAKSLDPENEAVSIYLKKLVVNTVKFKTMTEMYYPNQNPAYLGIIRFDRLFFSSAFANMQEKADPVKNYDVKLMEQDARGNLGYQFPVGDSLGIAIELFGSHYKDALPIKNMPGISGDHLFTNSSDFGVDLSLGWGVSDYFSIGAGASFYEQVRDVFHPAVTGNINSNTVEEKNNGFRTSGFVGFLIKDQESTLIFDSMAGYSNEKQYTLDPVNYRIAGEVKSPVYNENTLTKAFLDKRVFIVLKEVNNFYTDRDYRVIRAIPAIEVWPFTFMSIRGGYEYSRVKMDNTTKTGAGFTGGLSFRSVMSGFDLDVNYTKRNRPSRILEGETLDEAIIFCSISKSNLFYSR